jgi:hypothetical protein
MRFFEFRPVINEILSKKGVEKGKVAFKRSDISDAYIAKVIQQVSTETGVPYNDLINEMTADIEKFKEVGKYSPLLYDTIIQNYAENSAFKLIWKSKHPVKKENYKLDVGVFKELLRLVQMDHESFFPLRAPDGLQIINRISPILVPSQRQEYVKAGFNTIETAAVTNTGEFIFNVPFLESLLYYGTAVDVKPQGKKYVDNGGTIPNNYCYIEFIIVHEILHWAYGDFFAGNRFKQYSGRAHNIASDLRSNYLLVKNGYEQLPLGLFSDDLNFDRPETNSYQKLIAVVDRELKKMPKQLQAWIEETTGGDVHPPGDPWKPKPGEICLNNKTGGFVMITKDNGDGTYESNDLTKEQVEAILGKTVNVG